MINKPKGQDMANANIHPVSLDRETRANLPTPEAAFHLNRAQQTLRLWAMRVAANAGMSHRADNLLSQTIRSKAQQA
jgi:hypothetical protein